MEEVEVLETSELESDESETVEGVGEGDALGDGMVVVELATGGSLPAPMAPAPGVSAKGNPALILTMRLRSPWSRR